MTNELYVDYPRIAQIDETATLGIRDLLSPSSVLDLIFPPSCAICKKELQSSKKPLVCHRCQEQILADVQQYRCPKCGSVDLPAPTTDEICRLCLRSQSPVERSYCLNNYERKLRDAVLEAKKPNGDQLAFQLGRLLADQNRAAILHRQIRIVVPIPAFWLKRFKRGYTASQWIARGMAFEIQQLNMVAAVRCIRQTEKQALLTTEQRKKNVKNAFVAKSSKSLVNQPVLVVDDVMTSGSTMTEVAWTLLEAGVKSVDAAFLARGIGHE